MTAPGPIIASALLIPGNGGYCGDLDYYGTALDVYLQRWGGGVVVRVSQRGTRVAEGILEKGAGSYRGRVDYHGWPWDVCATHVPGKGVQLDVRAVPLPPESRSGDAALDDVAEALRLGEAARRRAATS